MNIRFANMADANTIGTINYTSWKETYRGIVDDSYMDAMAPEQYQGKWHSFFKNESPDKFLMVVANDTGEVVGYCCAGKIWEPLHNFDAEVYALYLLKQYHGKGWGKALMLAAMKELNVRGFGQCCVFVLKGNPAEGFYRSLKPDWEGTNTVKLGDKEYAEIALGWFKL